MQVALRWLGTSRAQVSRRGRVELPLSAKHVGCGTGEGKPPGERLEQRHADGVPVGRLRRARARSGFGCHVSGRAAGGVRAVIVGSRNELGDQTEVEDHHARLGCDEHVRGLDVAVELAEAVQGRYAVYELPKRRHEALVRAPGVALTSQVLNEVGAPHELHREETAGVVGEQLVQADQIGMHDIREASKLTFQSVRVSRCRVTQCLEGHDFVPDRVVYLVDDPHTAHAQSPTHREPRVAQEVVLDDEGRGGQPRRLLQKRLGAVVRGQQPRHVGPKLPIGRAHAIEKDLAHGGGLIQGLVKDRLQALVTLARIAHVCDGSSPRWASTSTGRTAPYTVGGGF